MKIESCAREAEVVERITAGGWPQCAGAELRAHVDVCPVCTDVVTVASAMREEHTLACQEATIPSAGLVWWRAELRARGEAARAAARPIAFLQIVAGTCAVAALLTAIGLLFPWFRAFLRLAASAWADGVMTIDVPSVTALVSRGGLPLLLAAGAWLVLAPVALYFAIARE